VAARTEIRRLRLADNWARAVALTPDGRRVVTVIETNTIKVWDMETGAELLSCEEVLALAGHTNAVNSIAFPPNNRYLVSASDDATLRVWDVERREPVATFTADHALTACSVSDDGTIIAGSVWGRIHLLRLEEP
jgi:WD40 repeat protein